MRYGLKLINSFLAVALIILSKPILASEIDNRLHIHVNYQQASDSWQVRYQLPMAMDHIAFQRRSNFDRSKLYNIDESKFTWQKEGEVLLIKSIDGSKFDSLTLDFPSSYGFIQKDYTPNLKYTDGSVLLYTGHLALGASIVEDKALSSDGVSFSGTQFHFNSPNQNIVFLGQHYTEKAKWNMEADDTYVYFGNIKPLENDNMIAIVDPALPSWVWQKTVQNFPKLFDYYASKTGQPLNFKPVVFFNYDHLDGDYANYSGGTLDGLVQLTVNGKHWQEDDKDQFNKLFHFLAHEAAHFWNGQMFAFEEQNHSWLHEGGADAFANFAMLEFGLIDQAQMMQKFEEASNQCILRKGAESLAQSAKLWRYRNYYTCGAAMALASHFAVKANNSKQTFFDVWQHIFTANLVNRRYTQQDYFDALSKLTGSPTLAKSLAKFSDVEGLNNQQEISSWFQGTELSAEASTDYPSSVIRHWGAKVIFNLMHSHCNKGVSFSTYDDYIETYPMDNCDSDVFSQNMNIQFVEGKDILADGLTAYNLFKAKCQQGEAVTLQDRNNKNIAEISCLKQVPSIKPYLKLSMIDS